MNKKLITLALLIALPCILCLIVWGGTEYMLAYSLSPATSPGSEAAHLRALEDAEAIGERYPWTAQWMDSIRADSLLMDTFITNSRGLRMHAYYLPAAKRTNQTAFIIHGYGCHGLSMMHIGYLYHHDMGYNIFLPDLHAHGESEGEAIQMGWLDRLDAEEWIPVADSIFGGETQMVVHGISMGAATTMMMSGDVLPPCITHFVEDCGYTSTWDIFSSEIHRQFHLPEFPLLYAASYLCKQRYGWDFKEASAVEQVHQCTLPMLFIHGEKDTFVPTSMIYEVYEAKPEPKAMWVAPGSIHALSYRDHPTEYTRRVREFLTPAPEEEGK